MFTEISQCRVCGNSRLETVLQLGDQVLTGVFPNRPDASLIKGPLDLVRCVPEGDATCGLLQLGHSYPADAMYGDNYGYRSGLNSSMVAHLQQKAARLAALARPQPGDLLVDIGSNDGTLLRSYGEGFDRTGIDPVARKFLDHYPPSIEVITEFFGRELWQNRLGNRRARIITSVAMFYDIEQPLAFMQTIRDCLDEQGIWHFEQSYLPQMLAACAYDTICHEHIEYYALRQIEWMTRRAGLKIIALETSDVNGGSLAVTAARQESAYPEATEAMREMLDAEKAAGLEGMAPLHAFRERVARHREELIATVRELRESGLSVMGYGASTKGNVLLQYCGFTAADLPCIAEVNPEKFGCYTPGTNIPIVSESEMHARRPDVLLVLPWHFRANLLEREKEFLNRGGRMLFPLPAVELVGR